MIEVLVGAVVGMFMYDNAEFFETSKKQRDEGYEWVFNPKDHNPEVPAITLNENKVIWVLETD